MADKKEFPLREGKRIPFDQGYFYGASGTKYVFLDSLSIDAYTKYRELIPAVTLGLTWEKVFKMINGAIEALTTGNELLKGHRQALDLLFNLNAGIKDFTDNSRNDACLTMASLWIVTEKEDLSTFDQRVCDAKIEDWKKAGYVMKDFFLLCAQKIATFTEIYLEFNQTADELERKIQALPDTMKI